MNQKKETLMALEPMRFNQTFEIITDESAAKCEPAETGFDFENVEDSFRGLVDRLRSDYLHAELSDGGNGSITAYGGRDMHDGSFTNISLHPANDRARRWWPKALECAGLTR
ncbi:hypothetical protein [Paraburkholderia sp. J8-2]|uniref:hypothetical protein n=1 Tax=Paraburkholderia sp. J8-2 TaxID=2805440 RepID=UPI002AB6D138|nr:hypothetical protein [Paraburkholderia sp. J8-2]